MKLVAASKLTKAQAEMENARPFWNTSKEIFAGRGFLETIPEDLVAQKPVFIVMTSDRGLCGSINSSLVKATKKLFLTYPNARLISLGEKGRSALVREFSHQFVVSAADVGKRKLALADIESIIEGIVKTDFDYAFFLSNKFNSVISYENMTRALPHLNQITETIDLSTYEFDDEVVPEVLENVYEHYLSTLIYSSLAENSATELSARMTSMDNATKNAGEMITNLERKYNRTRQATITTELTEIIAGAESVKSV